VRERLSLTLIGGVGESRVRCVMIARSLSLVCGTALLALASTASAAPLGIAQASMVSPPTLIAQAHYDRCHTWRGRHYGWYRPRHFAYYPRNVYGSSWGMAASTPLVSNQSGNYCATPVKTCLLYEPGWLGTGCSCMVPGGRERGIVE
jgi:hypothetical protein